MLREEEFHFVFVQFVGQDVWRRWWFDSKENLKLRLHSVRVKKYNVLLI